MSASDRLVDTVSVDQTTNSTYSVNQVLSGAFDARANFQVVCLGRTTSVRACRVVVEDVVESIPVEWSARTIQHATSDSSKQDAVEHMKLDMEKLKAELELSCQQHPPLPPPPKAPLIPSEVGPPGLPAGSEAEAQRKQLDALREFCAGPLDPMPVTQKPFVKRVCPLAHGKSTTNHWFLTYFAKRSKKQLFFIILSKQLSNTPIHSSILESMSNSGGS